MSVRLDWICLGSDDNRDFYEFWPVAAQLWRKFFPTAEPVLAFSTKRRENDPLVSWLRKWGRVVLIPATTKPVQTAWGPVQVPGYVQGKMSRYFLAMNGGNRICMINDIDLLPLTGEYTENLLSVRFPGQFVSRGEGFYRTMGMDKGQVAAAYFTGEGDLFRNLLDPEDLQLNKSGGRIPGFVDRMFQYWHDKSDFHHFSDPAFPAGSRFSDERLLMAMGLHLLPEERHYRHQNIPQGIHVRLCRSDWRLDLEALKRGEYVEAHMLRPLHQWKERLQPMFDLLEVEFAFPPENLT